MLNAIIDELKESNRTILGCFPLYPPLELFHSMGLTPVVLWGLGDIVHSCEESDKHIQNYACSVARHMAEFVLTRGIELFDGLFMYNACDTLRNLPEILKIGLMDSGAEIPVLNTHIPVVPLEQANGRQYFKNEILSLIKKLEQIFEVSFSGDKFRRSVELYNEMRELLRQLDLKVAAGRMSFQEYSGIAIESHYAPVEKQVERLRECLSDSASLPNAGNKSWERVIISGILPPPKQVSEVIEDSGLLIAGNDIALMNRSCSYSPEAVKDPVEYYADFYSRHFPCTTLLNTADSRINSLLNLIRERDAGGLIFIGEKFCEYEYFEFPFLEKALRDAGIITLSLEFSIDDDRNIGAFKTRIEAFAELIRE